MSRSKKGRNVNGSGSIRKKEIIRNGKKYSYWEARYSLGIDLGTGKQKQKTITGKTKKEVAEKLRQVTHEIDEGTYHEPCQMTLAQWLEIWQKDYIDNVKQSTVYLYSRNVNLYIVPALGAVKLEQLQSHDIQKFYNRLLNRADEGKRSLSPKSIKNIHGVLHKALQQAISLGFLRYNPTDACILPKVSKKEIIPLNEDDITAFLNIINGHVHEHLYKVTIFTGLRESEVLGLQWDCIDFANRTILVKQQLRREQKKGGKYYMATTKNGKSRLLKVAPTVIEELRKQKQEELSKQLKVGDLWEGKNMVFSNPMGGYLSYRTIYDCFKRLVAKIGIPNARFHDLRHTYAVAAIQSGDDIKTVQENLGHATAAFTLDVYGHVTTHMKEASASRMEKFIQTVESTQ